jgi:hypothetical protein
MGSCKSVTSTQYSEKFMNYCLNGDLINAKKYFEENPNIDIHADEEFAFRYSCDLGHLEVAKWLWSLDPNIDSNILRDLYRESITNYQREVQYWLESILYPNKKSIYFSVNILKKIKKKIKLDDECLICKSNDVERINFNCNNKHNHCYCFDCLESAEKNNCFKGKCFVCFEMLNFSFCQLVVDPKITLDSNIVIDL